MVDQVPGAAPAGPEATPEQLADEAAAAQAVNDAGGDATGDRGEAPISHAAPEGGEPPAAEAPKIHPRLAMLDEIAARARADGPAPAEGDAEPAAAAPAEPAPAAAAEPATAAPAAPAAQPAKLVPLKIRGREVLVDESQLAALAQKGLAADETFMEAARLRAGSGSATAAPAPDSTRTPTTPAAPGDDQGTPTAPAAATPEDRKARAAAMAHTLQYGEESEAAAVIERLLEQAEARHEPAPSTEDVGAVVERVLTQRTVVTDFRGALEKIGTEYGDLMGDEDLRSLAAQRVHKERVKDLVAQGYDEGEVSALLRTDAGKQDLVAAHTLLYTQGKARDPYTIMKAAWDDVKTHYVQPRAPQPQSAAVDPARVANKQRLPQPPAPANARIPAPPAQRQQTRAEAIAETRRARGQPV